MCVEVEWGGGGVGEGRGQEGTHDEDRRKDRMCGEEMRR